MQLSLLDEHEHCVIFSLPMAVSLLYDNLQSAAPARPGQWCVQRVYPETEHHALDDSHQMKILNRNYNGLGKQVARLDGS
jgi:hypothetical protein